MHPVIDQDAAAAIGRAVAERTAELSRPVLSRADAELLAGLQGNALDRWLTANGIRPCGHGRYPRAAIERALGREARNVVAPRRRHSLRRPRAEEVAS